MEKFSLSKWSPKARIIILRPDKLHFKQNLENTKKVSSCLPSGNYPVPRDTNFKCMCTKCPCNQFHKASSARNIMTKTINTKTSE
jgi:Leu/Phe-tRNA-protein transferase